MDFLLWLQQCSMAKARTNNVDGMSGIVESFLVHQHLRNMRTSDWLIWCGWREKCQDFCYSSKSSATLLNCNTPPVKTSKVWNDIRWKLAWTHDSVVHELMTRLGCMVSNGFKKNDTFNIKLDAEKATHHQASCIWTNQTHHSHSFRKLLSTCWTYHYVRNHNTNFTGPLLWTCSFKNEERKLLF